VGERYRRVVYVALLVSSAAAVVAAVILLDRARRSPEPLALEFRTPLRRELHVDVGGAVARPGVYRLPAGARVVDALTAAGGALPLADLQRVNQAALLIDGQALRIPLVGATVAAGLVDLNAASAAELETLPGIGAVRAADIVASRERTGPFTRLEELVERGLVPTSVVEEIRPLLGPLP
jgi:competence protein ComEA